MFVAGYLRGVLVPDPDHPSDEEFPLVQHHQPGTSGGADRGPDPGLHELVRQPDPVRLPVGQLQEGLPQGDRLHEQARRELVCPRGEAQHPREQDREGDHPQQRHVQTDEHHQQRVQRHSVTGLFLYSDDSYLLLTMA